MKRVLITAALLALLVAVVASASAGTPAPLKAQLRVQKAKLAKLTKLRAADAATMATLSSKLTADQNTIDKLNQKVEADGATIDGLNTKAKDDAATITTLNGQVATLTAKGTQQAQAGLAAILAGSPDDMWNAVVQIFQAFPTLPADQFCGYDKTSDTSPGPPPTATDYTFTLWAGACAG